MPYIIYTDLESDKNIIIKDNHNKSGIYCWTNKINNKSYIGSSSNLNIRFKNYFSIRYLKAKESNSIIYSALLKYGHRHFNLKILEYCDKKDLITKEQYYLDLLKPEYNILKIANSRLGKLHSLDAKLKMSLSRKGKIGANLGINLSLDTKLKISETLKNKYKNKCSCQWNETIIIINYKDHTVKVYKSSKDAAIYLQSSYRYILRIKNTNKLFKKTYSIYNLLGYISLI